MKAPEVLHEPWVHSDRCISVANIVLHRLVWCAVVVSLIRRIRAFLSMSACDTIAKGKWSCMAAIFGCRTRLFAHHRQHYRYLYMAHLSTSNHKLDCMKSKHNVVEGSMCGMGTHGYRQRLSSKWRAVRPPTRMQMQGGRLHCDRVKAMHQVLLLKALH